MYPHQWWSHRLWNLRFQEKHKHLNILRTKHFFRQVKQLFHLTLMTKLWQKLVNRGKLLRKYRISGNISSQLTHFSPMFHFHTSWNRHKIFGFLTSSEKKKWNIRLKRVNLTNWTKEFSLTHFSPVFHFITPWKRLKTKSFLTLSEGIEMENWAKWVNVSTHRQFLVLRKNTFCKFWIFILSNLKVHSQVWDNFWQLKAL